MVYDTNGRLNNSPKSDMMSQYDTRHDNTAHHTTSVFDTMPQYVKQHEVMNNRL